MAISHKQLKQLVILVCLCTAVKYYWLSCCLLFFCIIIVNKLRQCNTMPKQIIKKNTR